MMNSKLSEGWSWNRKKKNENARNNYCCKKNKEKLIGHIVFFPVIIKDD
jgi:hypothetical protein